MEEEFNFLFEVGEVVRLNSDGPLMTVARQNLGKQMLECMWFDATDHLHGGDFHPEALLSIEDIGDE
jgi:uncharacterized protein YodC (DUF2158 family)